MRLIDADALKQELDNADCDGVIAGYVYKVIADVIVNASDIAAIPVEYLLGKALDAERAIYYCKGDAKRNADILFAARVVLELWKEDGA